MFRKLNYSPLNLDFSSNWGGGSLRRELELPYLQRWLLVVLQRWGWAPPALGIKCSICCAGSTARCSCLLPSRAPHAGGRPFGQPGPAVHHAAHPPAGRAAREGERPSALRAALQWLKRHCSNHCCFFKEHELHCCLVSMAAVLSHSFFSPQIPAVFH